MSTSLGMALRELAQRHGGPGSDARSACRKRPYRECLRSHACRAYRTLARRRAYRSRSKRRTSPETERRPKLGFTEGDIARAADLFRRRSAIQLDEIEQLTPGTLRAHSRQIPLRVEGAPLLDDRKTIHGVDRKPPCTTSQCALTHDRPRTFLHEAMPSEGFNRAFSNSRSRFQCSD